MYILKSLKKIVYKIKLDNPELFIGQEVFEHG